MAKSSVTDADSSGDAAEKLRTIAITGMPGSGKGEAARICEEVGIPVFSLGDIVRDHCEREGKGHPSEEIGLIADRERSSHGQDIWARRLMEVIDRDLGGFEGLAVIDGLRSKHEADHLKSGLGGDFKVFAIHSSPKARYERLKGRGRKDGPKNWEAFVARDRRELGWGLGEVIALADMMIVNESGLAELEMRIRTIMFREKNPG